MKLGDIRSAYIDFFIKNNHKHVKSSSLIPHNDNSLLFANAGMVQFKNVFLGLEERDYKRATTAQKCLRAGGKHNDLDNVGFTARHHTFFEMMGNFSFGDYFKEEAISYGFDFITKVLEIPKEKLLVTVYSEDEEAFLLWKKIAGFSEDKIIKIPTSDNFWMMGDTGPCGPCTEIFYDRGESVFGGPPGSKDENGDRFTEIWNIVFMQYNQITKEKREDIKAKSIDTGMGLERVASVLQGVSDNYDIDLFKTLINTAENLINVKATTSNKSSFKVITDHIRAASFMIADGVLPSNEGRGYVLRRIIRRAIRHNYILGNKEPILNKLTSTVVDLMKDPYDELEKTAHLIKETVKNEEEKFSETIEIGMKLLDTSVASVKGGVFPAEIAFKLYDTYGFPLDLTEDILKTHNIKVIEEDFNKLMQEQKDNSRKAWVGSGEVKENPKWFELAKSITTEFVGYSEDTVGSEVVALLDEDLNSVTELKNKGYIVTSKTPFYGEAGGQIGDTGEIYTSSAKAKVLDTQKYAGGKLIAHTVEVVDDQIRLKDKVTLKIDLERRLQLSNNHTAVHLFYDVALNEVLGGNVTQRGSYIAENRIRADIFYNKPLTREQIEKIEFAMNKVIFKNLKVTTESKKYEDAIEEGAVSLLGETYPDIVRVVKIGEANPVSLVLCGGTHSKTTGEIGLFKIISENSIKSGVRRIEFVTGKYALEYINGEEERLHSITQLLEANKNNVEDKIKSLIANYKLASEKLKKLQATSAVSSLEAKAQEVKGFNLIASILDGISVNDLKEIKNNLFHKYQNSVLALILKDESSKDMDSFTVSIDEATAKKLDLKALMTKLKEVYGINGGGNNFMIQGKIPSNLSQKFVEEIKEIL